MTDRSPGLGPGGPAAPVGCRLGGILLSKLTWENEGESNLFPPHTRNSPEVKDRRPCLLVLQPTIHPSQLSTCLRCQTSSQCPTCPLKSERPCCGRSEDEAAERSLCDVGNTFPGASASPSLRSSFPSAPCLSSILGTGRQCLPCTQTPPYTLELGDLRCEGCHTKTLLCF